MNYPIIQPSNLNLCLHNVISTSKKRSKRVDVKHMLQSKLAGNCNAGSRWQLESIAESEGIFHLEKSEIFKSQEWMSCVMKKVVCECLLNKDADDPHSNRVAGQPLCFCYIVQSL